MNRRGLARAKPVRLALVTREPQSQPGSRSVQINSVWCFLAEPLRAVITQCEGTLNGRYGVGGGPALPSMPPRAADSRVSKAR